MFGILKKFLDLNEKELQKLSEIVTKINSFESQIQKISPDELKAKTAEFKLRLERGESLDDLLPEAYACVREASKRTTDLRHFDVQLMAGICFHQGKIAEQKTGEGKTLSASSALYLNALLDKGCHLITVNDYLARRDCGWMSPIYHALGLSCAALIHENSFIYDPDYEAENIDDWRLKHLRPVSRKQAYDADITYGTNNEFGFDYLRDNMVWQKEQMAQRGHYFAVVDEVDSILIDEARTPLIISAPDTEPTNKYYQFAKLVEELNSETDYVIDEKIKSANLTEHGITKIEKKLGIENLYEKDFQTVHHIEEALKARTLFHKERDYIVKDNQVIIVDEFTGRLMFGRRYSEGLHQAIEAKEGVTIQQESKTLATISLQNYFRMYQKLAGMTGTAATEAEEFHKIYKLEVVSIPTNKPAIRIDYPDQVYKTQKAKYTAVANEIAQCHKKGQPVLVGTTSIEKNEIISELLKRKGIPHEVLNAKNHEREALIIEKAGQKGAVTVATNMAGRGVDIKLEKGVVEVGGLHVIGTERHEARRIDNQLRGRSGRQGDPGSSRFYVSLEDDIMRLFGGDQVARLMTVFNMPEDVPLEHGMVSRAIESAQGKVEGHNFDIRKHLVEYDDVMNKQREIIYARRKKIIENINQIEPQSANSHDTQIDAPLKEEILVKIENEIDNLVTLYSPEGFSEPEYEKIIQEFSTIIPFDEASQKQIVEELKKLKTAEKITEALKGLTNNLYEAREKQLGPQISRDIEKFVTLSVIDNLWIGHLDAVDDLREGIGLRGYGQRDPLVEYKNEAFDMFQKLIAQIDYEITRRIFKVSVQEQPSQQSQAGQVIETHGSNNSPTAPQTIVKKQKLGRNDPCPCGSGKKYKRCHG